MALSFKTITILFLFIFPLCVYLITISPTIGWIDSGELTTVCMTLGIAHPTGYPVHTLAGRLFGLIPIGNPAFRINLLSALFAALAGVALGLTVFILLENVEKRTAVFLCTIVSALCFSFSETLWSQAVISEVYSITAFFVSIIIFLLILFGREYSGKILLLINFLAGISLGNHLMIVWTLIPGFIYILWMSWREIMSKKVAIFFLLFLLGLSIYLYLPLRAIQNPVLSWGDVRTLERFFWHLTAKQYRVWMFSASMERVLVNLDKFLKLWINQFTPFLFWIGFLGIIYLSRRKRKEFFLFLFILFADVTYGINYDIPDIDSYFIPSFVIWSLFIGAGVMQFLEWLIKINASIVKDSSAAPVKRNAIGFLFVLFSILPLFPLVFNFHKNNLSKNFFAYDFGENVLRSLEKNALVLTNNWDIYSPVIYLQRIEGKRKDVVFVDKELLRRGWYFKYLKEQYPWLIEKSSLEVEKYLEFLKEFEEGKLRDNDEIQRRYILMINSFLERNLDRPLYITFSKEMDPVDGAFIGTRFQRIPVGLVYRLSLGNISPEDNKSEEFELRGMFDSSIYQDDRTRINLNNYPRMFFERGLYLVGMKRYHEAILEFRRVIPWKTSEVPSRLNIGSCYLALGNIDEAQEEFQRVLILDPENSMAESWLNHIIEQKRGLLKK